MGILKAKRKLDDFIGQLESIDKITQKRILEHSNDKSYVAELNMMSDLTKGELLDLKNIRRNLLEDDME